MRRQLKTFGEGGERASKDALNAWEVGEKQGIRRLRHGTATRQTSVSGTDNVKLIDLAGFF